MLGVSSLVFKIVTNMEWRAAERAGIFTGLADDERDGFIHLSAASQLPETAAKHFAGQADLLVVAFDDTGLGPALRWEKSRGGTLFPHLYGALDPRAARWAKPLPLGADGAHVLPPLDERS
ncbi:MAG: DUF952 domain-containing protein [Alphaproteobacteria bacterium]|nr:DUF952 domain-containing protein [Alphaproteobacteria bacterium]